MSPERTRSVLGVFLLAAGAIAVNALVFQSGPGTAAGGRAGIELTQQRATAERARRLAADGAPAKAPQAPTSIEDLVATGAQRLARLKPDAATAETLPEVPADAEGEPETIRAVQRELIRLGYGPLAGDGVPGLATRAAIMAYEHDHAQPIRGEATAILLSRLQQARPSTSAVKPVGSVRMRSAAAEQVMRSVQQSLTGLGYQPGRIDGRGGEETERAVREFEMDQGLVPTGRVSAVLVARLGAAASTPARADVAEKRSLPRSRR